MRHLIVEDLASAVAEFAALVATALLRRLSRWLRQRRRRRRKKRKDHATPKRG